MKYVLEASLAGFNAFRQEFELTSASDWDRAITLQVGKLSETVTREGQARARYPADAGIPQKKPTPVRVGGNIKAPTKIVNVNPVFPAEHAHGRTWGCRPARCADRDRRLGRVRPRRQRQRAS